MSEEGVRPARTRQSGLLLGGGIFLLMRLLPAPEGLPDAGWAVAALAVTMAIFWFTEALPIAATALLPFLLLPLMGVGSADAVASEYFSPILFLVLGGALFALALERAGLHLRVALAIARAVPSSPRGLVFAFLVATALVSTLISNTATVLIMMPVALGLLAVLEGQDRGRVDERLAPALVLGVAWGASIGGLGTLVGSPTNAISAAIIERSLGVEISFLTWAMFGMPVVLLAVPMAAFILIRVMKVPGGHADRAADDRVRQALAPPGPMGRDEKRLLPLLALLLGGWLLLPLVGPQLGLPRIDDGIVAVAVALLLFVVPSEKGGTLLDAAAIRRAPWETLLLYGGGLALAGALAESGLAAWIGESPLLSAGMPIWAIACLLVLLIVVMTEFASNVATASGFMPVVAAVIAGTGADPLLLAMPAALAASWGFMMPAASAPNAIAYGTGRIRVPTMIRAGFWLNIGGVVLIVAVSMAVAALL